MDVDRESGIAGVGTIFDGRPSSVMAVAFSENLAALLTTDQMPECRLDIFRMQIAHDILQRCVLQQQAVGS